MRALLGRAAASLAVAVIVLGYQWAGGSYVRELSGYPDEPVHYVTGVLARDYIAGLFPGPPAQFAEKFYAHYPLIGLGHWPPVFYILQAAWTVPFGASRVSVMLLMAVLEAALLAFVFLMGRKAAGAPAALASVLALASRPLFAAHAGMVMSEIPLSLFVFAAACALGRYMETERPLHIYAFALASSLAIMTKGNGLLLALAPPLAMLFGGRLGLLRRRAAWLAAAFTCAICLPWYLYWLDLVLPQRSPVFIMPQHIVIPLFIQRLLNRLVEDWGPGPLALAAFGLARNFRAGAVSSSMAGLIVSVFVFHTLISPHSEGRNLVTGYPAIAYFLAAGAGSLLPRQKPVWQAALVALACLPGLATYKVPRKLDFGFRAIERELGNDVVLVSSEAVRGGAFIAERVMTDPRRPSRVVVRADRILADSSFVKRRYEPVYLRPEQVLELCERLNIGAVVVDKTPGYIYHHHRLLLLTIAAYPGRFKLERDGQVAVYRFVRPP